MGTAPGSTRGRAPGGSRTHEPPSSGVLGTAGLRATDPEQRPGPWLSAPSPRPPTLFLLVHPTSFLCEGRPAHSGPAPSSPVWDPLAAQGSARALGRGAAFRRGAESEGRRRRGGYHSEAGIGTQVCPSSPATTEAPGAARVLSRLTWPQRTGDARRPGRRSPGLAGAPGSPTREVVGASSGRRRGRPWEVAGTRGPSIPPPSPPLVRRQKCVLLEVREQILRSGFRHSRRPGGGGVRVSASGVWRTGCCGAPRGQRQSNFP